MPQGNVRVKITADTKDLERGTRRAERSLDGLGSKTKSFAKAATGASLALGGAAGIGLALKSVTSAAIEAEKAQARLNAQLKAIRDTSAATKKQIDGVIQSQSQMSGFDDESLSDSFVNIVRVTKDVDQALKLNNLAMDLARAKQIDVAKAGELVGKVAGGNTGILARYGIQIEKGASATEALAEVQKRVSGQTEAYGKTTAGSLDRMDVAIENVKERLGSALAPTVTDVADKVAKFATEMDRGTGAGGRFADDVKELAGEAKEAAEPIVRIGKAVGGFVKDNPELAKTAAQFAIIGGAAAKISRLSGLGGILKLGFGRGNTPATPMYTKDVLGPGVAGVPGGPGGRRVPRAGAALAGGAALFAGVAASQGDKLGAGVGGAVAGSKFGPGGAVAGALAGVAVAKEVGQSRAKKEDIKNLKDVYSQLGINRAEANKLKLAMSQMHGPLRGIPTEKLGGLRKALDGAKLGSVDAQRKIDGLRSRIGKLLDGQTISLVKRSWDRLEKDGEASLTDIRTTVERNTRRIRSRMDLDTQAGANAVADNFSRSRDAVAGAMKDKRVSVETGMREIRRLLGAALSDLGFSEKEIANYLKSSTGDIRGGNSGASGNVQGKYGGGWIGSRGQAGRDTVPAMLGRGEAVLNRHQQQPVEAALGMAYGMTLDDLFAKVRTPHYAATGGRIPRQRVPGHGAVTAAGQRALDIDRNAANSLLRDVAPNVSGAGDVNGLTPQVKRAIAWARTHGWNGRVTSGFRSFADQTRLWNNRASNPFPVARPGTSNHEGGQAVDVTDPDGFRRAMAGAPAGSRLKWFGPGDRVHFSITGRARGGLVRFASGGKAGQYSNTALQQLWVKAGGRKASAPMAAAIAEAESSGRSSATNRNSDRSIDRGLWQINSVHGALSTLSPTANARSAVSISRNGRNWAPWVTFKTGAYKRFLKPLAATGKTPAPDAPAADKKNEAAYKRAVKDGKTKPIYDMAVTGANTEGLSAQRKAVWSRRATAARRNLTAARKGIFSQQMRQRAERLQGEPNYDDAWAAAQQTPSYGDNSIVRNSAIQYWDQQIQRGLAGKLPQGGLARATSERERWGTVEESAGNPYATDMAAGETGPSQADLLKEQNDLIREIRDLDKQRVAILGSVMKAQSGPLSAVRALTVVMNSELGGSAGMGSLTPSSSGTYSRF